MTKYFVGHSTDYDIRFKSSSGGIGTAIMKYLLDSGLYNMAITFLFNPKEMLYKPILINSASEIRICGSIYQDIDIYRFIKENLSQVHGNIVVSCPPCQVVPIKNLLQKNDIKSFVISFCCSGQMRIEGTWCYYRFLGIKKENVVNMQYRGNGWPSGIQIWLKDGTKIYRDNYTEPWSTIHRSNLYKPKRCLYCKYDTSYKSDVSLADPWLNDYLEKDSIANTLFIVNTEQGNTVINEMAKMNIVEFVPTDYNSYYQAQRPNVEKANRIRNQQRFLHTMTRLMEKPWYRDYFSKTPSRMKKHIKIRQRIFDLSTWDNTKNMLTRIIIKIKCKIRFICIAPKLGSHGKHFNISGGVILNNPQCIHLGENVGIGENAFFLPVTQNNGSQYEPCIIIGEGTWVGKGCSIAAINRVEIGRHVLFAGQVHITDHSHGYEDISKPISPQTLISKGPVIIEDDCWLGYSCEILSGVHIGKHCVIAARAVVTKDVPSYSIVAGNPARIVKQYNFHTERWEKIAHINNM